jgi:hypothetical protein
MRCKDEEDPGEERDRVSVFARTLCALIVKLIIMRK